MRNDLDYEELFARVAGADEELSDDWMETICDRIHDEGRLVGRQDWDSGGPGAGAGTMCVYQYKGVFVGEDDVGSYGPYDRFAEAAEAIGLWTKTSATQRIWVDPHFGSES